jgi:hypothetical protein
MSTSDAIFNRGKPLDVIGHDVGKLTPPQDTIFGTIEPRHAIRHDVGKPTLSVETPKDAILAQVRLGMPLDTKLQNRRRDANLKVQMKPIKASVRYATLLVNRRRASRRIHKIGNVAEMSLGIRITL